MCTYFSCSNSELSWKGCALLHCILHGNSISCSSVFELILGTVSRTVNISLSFSIAPSESKTQDWLKDKRFPLLLGLCYLPGHLPCQSFVYQYFSLLYISMPLWIIPFFLLPCGVHFNGVCGENLSVILTMWQIHCHLLSITVDNGVMFVSFNKMSFLMVFGQNVLDSIHTHFL